METMSASWSDPRRRSLPRRNWPAIDRERWEMGTTPSTGLDDPGHADRWSAATRGKIEYGYARWLGFLELTGDLDPTTDPADRVTSARASAYFRLLKELGLLPYSIVARFAELGAALRVIAPERDFGWLTRPGGRSLRSRLHMVRKHRPVLDTRDLFAWGLRLLREAPAIGSARARRLQMRDGLLIALLAPRAKRLRALCAIRIGLQLVCDAGTWWFKLRPEDMKTRRHLDYELPEEVVPHLERYLAIERHELLGGREHDWLWVSRRGTRLSKRAVDQALRDRARREFGQGFGAHVFRYALASTAAEVNPSEPGLGPAVLGISARVFQQSYNRAGTARAAERFHATLAASRARLEPLARRSFAWTAAHETGPSGDDNGR